MYSGNSLVAGVSLGTVMSSLVSLAGRRLTAVRHFFNRDCEAIEVGRRVVQRRRDTHTVALRRAIAENCEQSVAVEELAHVGLVAFLGAVAVQTERRDCRDGVRVVRSQDLYTIDTSQWSDPAVPQVAQACRFVGRAYGL